VRKAAACQHSAGGEQADRQERQADADHHGALRGGTGPRAAR